MKRTTIIKCIAACIVTLLVASCVDIKTNMSDVTKDITLTGSSGKLQAVLQTPTLRANEKVPLVILMHGITAQKEDSLMVSLAHRLREEGIASIRFDFNGHGASDGRFEDMTVPKEIDDAHVVYEYAKSLPFVKNISLLGHSQGGVVASMLAGELGSDSIKCLVLMAPAAVLKDDALHGTSLGARFDPNDIPEYIPIFKELRIGREYMKEAQQLPIYETAAGYHGKVCIIHGQADAIVATTYSDKYHEIYEKSILHFLNKENHSFTHNMEKSVKIAVDFLKQATE